MKQSHDSRSVGGASACIHPRSVDTQFPIIRFGRFDGYHINKLPVWYLEKMAADTSRPFLCICAQCALNGDPAPSRDDVRVLALEAAKEKRKEVISSR